MRAHWSRHQPVRARVPQRIPAARRGRCSGNAGCPAASATTSASKNSTSFKNLAGHCALDLTISNRLDLPAGTFWEITLTGIVAGYLHEERPTASCLIIP
jgi:hypothetical protein